MHKVAKFAIAISLVLVGALAFQIFIVVDEAQPAGTTTAFLVESIDTVTKDDALDVIATAAGRFEGNVFKVHPEPDDSFSGRVLFAFVGNETAFDSSGGFNYPSFSPQAQSTRIVPGEGITTEDLRGRYVTSLEPDQMPELLAFLAAHGVVASDDTVGWLGIVLLGIGQGNFAGTLVVAVLALLLAITYSVARHRKIYALKALHGYRRITNLGTELAAASRIYAIGILTVAVVGLPVLGVYNGFHQAGRFLTLLALALIVLYVVISLIVVFAVLLLDGGHIAQILKGERAVMQMAVFAAIVQVAVLAITVATASATMNRIAAIGESTQTSSQWTRDGPLYALRLSTTGTHDDDMRDAPVLAEVISELEKRDQVLLVHHNDYAEEGDPAAGYEPNGAQALMVNNEYLRRQVVLDTNSDRVGDSPAEVNEFTLLVPQNYHGDAHALLAVYEDWFRQMCTLGRVEESFTCSPQGNVVTMAPGQTVSTYGQTNYLPVELQGKAQLNDPVIAVVSTVSQLISPMSYLSYISTDDVFFSDAEALDEALKHKGIRGSFQGIDNGADAVATAVTLAQRELRMDTLSITFGIAVLLSASVVLVMVYCDRRQRAMFVELIHGYGFATRHWRYLVTTVVMACAGAGIGLLAGGTTVPGREIAIATGLIAIQVVVSGFAVKIYETRFRADFIKRD